ncbi:hypothetical protein E3N88_23586 [Mikania micrantha]|uniref:Uncharacterized protein n=1 Tax=Mikania micrantha TaxID=192012 RepID=A0A5N6NG85_9ASTR|nr:hypothetical protein E3N88_23586 [Mikania micrantha]
MADLRFVHDHNMTAFLGEPPAKHSEFKSMVDGLILSPINYAIMEYPPIMTDFVRSFWSTVEESVDADGNITIVGKIQGHPIIISEQIIRECLQFGDKDSDPVELDQELVNRTVFQMGHEGKYPPIEKKKGLSRLTIETNNLDSDVVDIDPSSSHRYCGLTMSILSLDIGGWIR